MKFFNGNGWLWRMLRTFAQALLGVTTVESITYIVGGMNINPELRAVLVPIIMMFLSPIMAKLGEWLEKQKENEVME